MALKTYGHIHYDRRKKRWEIDRAEPHICIRMKSIFPKLDQSQPAPFHFVNNPGECHDLLWFMDRYPLEISDKDRKLLGQKSEEYINRMNELERILKPDYVPKKIKLRRPFIAREYQRRAAEFHSIQRRFLLGDDIGLGKTLSGILTFGEEMLPAIAVCQTHLPAQWKNEGVEKFTNLKAHIIKGTRPYTLPPADVYIIKYSCLSGWTDFFGEGYFKSVVFDEVQELRIMDSQKYSAAKVLSNSVEYCMGMSATPIYNYGDEIFNVLDLINPGSLGKRDGFLREWCVPKGQRHYVVVDPAALGTYLRESNLFLRRTREDVGMQLPPINKIIYPVEYDHKMVKDSMKIAKQLAIAVTSGSFVERGQAARELNALIRHDTGVSKAKEVAEFVKILMDNGEPVLLAGWHRKVYDIWMEILAEYKPVLYTGSETAAAKQRAKDEFLTGQTNLFIISLRSGIGLDGLQHRCKNVVFGELDWSPKVHDQVIGRVDRDGQKDQVTAFFCVSEFGSDQVMLEILGLKSDQSTGIVDPMKGTVDQYSDETHIQKLAQRFLEKSSDGELLFPQ